MTPSFLKKRPIKSIERTSMMEPRRYIDLGETSPMDIGEETINNQDAGPFIKIAEIYRYEDAMALSEIIYNGDVLLIDYNNIASDELTLRRVINELKNITRDVGGDVAGIGRNYLLVTPTGMRISRKKIKGSSSL